MTTTAPKSLSPAAFLACLTGFAAAWGGFAACALTLMPA